MEENELELDRVPEDMSGQTDPLPVKAENNNEPANPVNTGLPETSQDQEDDQKDKTLEKNTEDDLENTGDGASLEGGEAAEPSLIVYQIDPDAQYHAVIDNSEDDPVPVSVMQEDPFPVIVTETLIEKEPGIMEKHLEDYTVTEALLLMILITLWLRILFDYFGRRNI